MYIFLDTETTGVGDFDRLYQVAFKYNGHEVNEFFNPNTPLHPEAARMGGVTDSGLSKYPTFMGSPTWELLRDLLNSGDYTLVAHNARFDIRMLEAEGLVVDRHICTLKIVRQLHPEYRMHNLQHLREVYSLDDILPEARPHDAFGDVLVLKALFERLYAEAGAKLGNNPIEWLLYTSYVPNIHVVMPFGKYKDTPVDEVPSEYLEYLQRQPNLDEDMAATLVALGV